MTTKRKSPGLDSSTHLQQGMKKSGINFFSYHSSKSVFSSEIVDIFQITFHAKIHVNDIFSFFKNYF